MSFLKGLLSSGMLRKRLNLYNRIRGGDHGHGHGHGESRWTSQGMQERLNGYLFIRTPPPPGQSREWEDWELPYYVTAFLTVVILGIGLNAKPDLTLETWAHNKAIERLDAQGISVPEDAN
ncbi:uncharacterized protein LOC18439885 [Amborella trichopoda]|uniref:Complex I-ESSS n=1 Tax=Amborella trichopoda TaxID=13333 RepID=W1PV53_AMBTC|nr:uncharacterized protein LOC18439885 [Amborella trichopoda]XP_020526372.1 uncharacterized protein LOC18439885 [Amborella trichopoda]ERN11684.1 hypothetical protein AMTR_s00022p00224350 [Amborella trichopoda]|eukprot:XP_006850103.1 uncharacterized protein LOC18439885 [Amborella trichopoda]